MGQDMFLGFGDHEPPIMQPLASRKFRGLVPVISYRLPFNATRYIMET